MLPTVNDLERFNPSDQVIENIRRLDHRFPERLQLCGNDAQRLRHVRHFRQRVRYRLRRGLNLLFRVHQNPGLNR